LYGQGHNFIEPLLEYLTAFFVNFIFRRTGRGIIICGPSFPSRLVRMWELLPGIYALLLKKILLYGFNNDNDKCRVSH
jgi:hypothetical protein